MEDYTVGSIVKCEVTGIEPYGIFIKIDSDHIGLIHISEISNSFISDIGKYVNVGEKIYAKIIENDNVTNKLKLSIRGLNYKEFYKNRKVNESISGFSPLQDKLPMWTDEALDRIKQS